MQITLEKIDLSNAKKHECEEINDTDDFLALISGEFHVGKFSRQWYGWNFNGWRWNPGVGLQFDAPGSNCSKWEGLWKLKKDLAENGL